MDASAKTLQQSIMCLTRRPCPCFELSTPHQVFSAFLHSLLLWTCTCQMSLAICRWVHPNSLLTFCFIRMPLCIIQAVETLHMSKQYSVRGVKYTKQDVGWPLLPVSVLSKEIKQDCEPVEPGFGTVEPCKPWDITMRTAKIIFWISLVPIMTTTFNRWVDN